MSGGHRQTASRQRGRNGFVRQQGAHQWIQRIGIAVVQRIHRRQPEPRDQIGQRAGLPGQALGRGAGLFRHRGVLLGGHVHVLDLAAHPHQAFGLSGSVIGDAGRLIGGFRGLAYDFRERCDLAGIHVPIIAGIMPITTTNGMRRMAELAAGSRFPARLLKALERAGNNQESVRRVGLHYATEQCADLLNNKVAGIHFYTLNQSSATREIYANLGLKSL